MSSGSLMQLSAVGKQDVDTVMNAQLTFWKSMTRRHTPFAMEPKFVEFSAMPTYGRRGFAQVERIGDLAARVWLYFELDQLDNGGGGAHYVDDVGRAIIEEVELQMGQVQFERIIPEYMHAWEELTTDDDRQLGMLTGKAASVAQLIEAAKGKQYIWIPLEFSFTQEYGSALPLIAMHLTDIKIYVKLKQKADIIVPVTPGYTITSNDAVINDMHLVVETVILDDSERDWFVNTPLKYIIHQAQYNQTTIRSGVMSWNTDLIFNHPVKELIILFRKGSSTSSKAWFDFSGQEVGPYVGECFKSMGLTVNSNVRVPQMSPHYWRVIQPKYHHSRIPKKHIYVYSFALYPEDANPSGSINFSRIDTTRLICQFSATLPEEMEQIVIARNINNWSLTKGVGLLTFAA